MAKIIIDFAPEPAEIVADLIETIDEHSPLHDADIVCLFTNQKLKHSEKIVLGKATKQGAITKFFASGDTADVDGGPDYVLVFNRAQWSGLNAEQKLALVDHQLMHCRMNSKVSKSGKVTKSWGVRGHDIEEFRGIVERHGFTFRDEKEFAEIVAAKQLELDQKQPAAV